MALSFRPDLWPTAVTCADPLALLAAQHDALREVLDELPAAVYDDGSGDVALAHVTRAVFGHHLAWHHGDEEVVLLPRLVGIGSGFDVLCATCRDHHRASEAAAWAVAELAAPICSGDDTDPVEWREACDALRRALEASMQLEDDALWPALRQMIERDDREDIAAALRARAEGRPDLVELVTPIAAGNP